MSLKRNYRRSIQISQSQKVYLVFIMASLFLTGTIFINLSLKTEKGALEILQSAYRHCVSVDEYSYTAVESGDDYTLTFAGTVLGDELRGTIKEYDLEVKKKGDALFVKTSSQEEWQKAADMGLKNIDCFVRKPDTLLQSLLAHGEEKDLKLLENSSHVSLIEMPYVSEDRELIYQLFPGLTGARIKDFEMYVQVEDNQYLRDIELILSLILPDSTEETISRSLLLDFSSSSPTALFQE